jgi:hypothetical protein
VKCVEVFYLCLKSATMNGHRECPSLCRLGLANLSERVTLLK